MILLNRIVENMAYIVGYIFHLYIRNQNFLEMTDALSQILAKSLVNYFIMKRCFTNRNMALNVGYPLHLVLICMYQLNCIEKQNELTYNFGYLSFINEY